MIQNPVRRAARVATAVTVAMALVLPLSAPASADDGREGVYDSLHIDQVPADYVILVDTSGSMTNRYGAVRSTLGTFLAGLSAVDHVALFTFSTTTTPRYIGPAGDPYRMLADVPPVPDGGSTDIGEAIEQAVTELERPDAAAVASVVLITDGLHSPGAGSDYPQPEGPAWQALKDRADRLRATSVRGYALPLSGATGASLLGSVLKDTTVLDPSAVARLGDYLDRSKAGARLEKARVMLAPDRGKGVTVTWQAPATADVSRQAAPIALALHADTTLTPLTVTGLRAAFAGGPVPAGDLPARVDLAPGETRTFPLHLAWQRDPWLIPFHDRRTADGPLSVTATVTSPWVPALAPDLDLAIPPAPAGAAPRVTVVSTTGTWQAQGIAVAVAVLLLLVVALLGYLRWRAPQSGMLVAVSPMTGQELGRFRLSGRVTRVAGQGLTGEGTVVAKRVPRQPGNTDGIEYEITFRRLERTDTTRLPSRGTVLVGGVAFEHQPG